MEDPVPHVSNMVSRLPKFGSRPLLPTAVPGTAPSTNGIHYPAPVTMGKGLPTASSRQNGVIRTLQSSSLKWKKEKDDSEEREGEREEGGVEAGHQPQRPMAVQEIRKPSTMPVMVKVRRCISVPSSSSPRSTSSSPRTTASKSGPCVALPKHASPGPSLCNGKVGVNGRPSGVGRPGTSSLKRGQNRASPSSDQTGGLSHSQSSDSLEAASEENMVRSQSLTHVKRIPSPSEPPIIRSYSFSRASEPTKELPRHLAKPIPVKTSLLTKPNSVLGSADSGSTLHAGKAGSGLVLGRAGAGTASGILPPSALRKSLLPSPASNSTKGSAISYRLTRPSLIKQPRPVLAPAAESEGRRNSVETPPITPDASSTTDSPGSTPEGLTVGLLEEATAPSAARSLGEGLEDMSLSSTSSLEHNDNSEEYMDDFDNLGNGGDGFLLQSARDGAPGVGRDDSADDDNTDANHRHSFLSEGVDWAGIGIAGTRGSLRVLSRHASQALSGGADNPHGSSLDLSPSDSGSGGTYMWDEEGLEPLGTSSHPCGSYDSELNSMDILNNLEQLESVGDLDEDDLMLEDDLPEDGSFQTDTDRLSHLAHWRQLCWTAEDSHNNDNSDVGFQPYDEYQGQDTGAHQAAELDEQTLKHMAEDCCSVKAQLQHLKLLLQMEDGSEMDDTLTLDSLSPESREDPVQSQQVEELLKEVQQLKEELRRKDRIIAQLTQQMAVPAEPLRCRCQQPGPGGRDVERRTVTYQDKATQTHPWKGHAPQILQPSRIWATGVQQPQERLTSSARSEAPSEPSCSATGCNHGESTTQPSSLPGPAPTHAPPAGLLLRSQLKISDPQDPRGNMVSAKSTAAPRFQHSPGTKKTPIPYKQQEGPSTTAGMTMVGFPRMVRGIQGRGGLSVGLPAPQSRLRQLMPPSRSLPCYSSASLLCPTLTALPQTKAPRQTTGLREPGSVGLKTSGLGLPSLLRIPKPKSH
ncbi:hypothetical protein UPYG_G00137830 [Umbra pygmaea]|uniref:Serine-rich coiled-coil domain-containing protein 2-like n=1 Tax=Umbra pygmaea TaxID=75934 RepID=A0ABD0XHC0_UMBPY